MKKERELANAGTASVIPRGVESAAVEALSLLVEMAENKGTDLHADFNEKGELRERLKSALEFVEANETLDLPRLFRLSEVLGFVKLDPLIQILEARELVDLVWKPRFAKESDRLKAWGLTDRQLEGLVESHSTYLFRALLELSFRRGVVLNDHEAVKSILWSKGNREPGEYFFNVVSGWLAEEGVVSWLLGVMEETEDVEVEKMDRSGLDADRIIRFQSGRIAGDVDLEVQVSFRGVERVISVEIQRADASRKKSTRNAISEELVLVPSHRTSIAKDAVKRGENLVLLFPYLGKRKDKSANELGVVGNPAEKFDEYKDEPAVWCRFYPIRSQELKEVVIECFAGTEWG